MVAGFAEAFCTAELVNAWARQHLTPLQDVKGGGQLRRQRMNAKGVRPPACSPKMCFLCQELISLAFICLS